jgi:hypothetical protein
LLCFQPVFSWRYYPLQVAFVLFMVLTAITTTSTASLKGAPPEPLAYSSFSTRAEIAATP